MKLGRQANDVFGVPRSEQRAPVHLGGRGIIEERRDRSLQEGRKAGKRCLPELAERQSFVRLEGLKPSAKSELMASPRQRYTVLQGEEISGDGEVASIIAAGQADLGLGV